MPLPLLHPLEKTSIEMRRQIVRLKSHLLRNPEDELVQDILEGIETLRKKIPASERDTDLKD
jgi:hypothetical protein